MAIWAWTIAATVLCAGAALATPTPQQECDYARIMAWKVYVSCVDGVVAKTAKGTCSTGSTTRACNLHNEFANCNYKYFRRWKRFQGNARLSGSTCIGSRFTDNGDGTTTDNLTELVWEKKTNLDNASNYADPHDADNFYSWSTGSPYYEDGAAFTNFLASLNSGAGFAGANGWRLPTLVELQTTVLDFFCPDRGGITCACTANPCVDPALGPTIGYDYYSSTTYVSDPRVAWTPFFASGSVYVNGKGGPGGYLVRAVRGGL